MFKVVTIKNDNGVELSSVLEEMARGGFKLKEITPSKYQNCFYDNPTKWPRSSGTHTEDFWVSEYLCIFEK